MNEDQLRDRFAMHAFSGLLAHHAAPLLLDGQDAQTARMTRERYAALARASFEMADAMMKARTEAP